MAMPCFTPNPQQHNLQAGDGWFNITSEQGAAATHVLLQAGWQKETCSRAVQPDLLKGRTARDAYIYFESEEDGKG
jgi:hypothetical protein